MAITRREFIESTLAIFSTVAVQLQETWGSAGSPESLHDYQYAGNFFVSQDPTSLCQILAQQLRIIFPKPGQQLDCFRPLCEIRIGRMVAPAEVLKAFLDQFMDINSELPLLLAKERITPKTPHVLLLRPKLVTVGMSVHSAGTSIVESLTWLAFQPPRAVCPQVG